MVNENNLRFDFNHFEKPGKNTIQDIEDIVNSKILENHAVETRILTLEEAKKIPKIKMYFGDKYGSLVRAVVIDEKFSIELCGGTHVNSTAEIGFFKVISESAIASGIRRIEAITGTGIKNYLSSLNNKIDEKNEQNLELQDRLHKAEKRIKEMELDQLSNNLDVLLNKPAIVNDIPVVIGQFEDINSEKLRDLAEVLRGRFPDGIGLLTSSFDGKISIVCVVGDNIVTKYNAGKLVSLAAKYLGGGGGGKAHLAQAGGKNSEKLPDLLNKEFFEIIQSF